MADHFHYYELKTFAGTVADCMNFKLPETYATGIKWVSTLVKERLGGPADRAVIYHADAVGSYMFQQYPYLFAPVQRHTSMIIPFVSTKESVNPVVYATMYTGVDPEVHGIQTYVRPKLTCDTLFDQYIKAGKKVAVLTMQESTFNYIFAGRKIDFYNGANALEIREKAIKLIEKDRYDLLSIHTLDYDSAAHHYGPEAKESKNALSLEAEGFDAIAEAIKKLNKGHRTLLTYSPDHGQHLTLGGTGTHGSNLTEDMNVFHFVAAIR